VRPLFTVHAGEFLVGQHIESTFKDKKVWVPTKDSGVDLLLVTNAENTKAITLQVKFSRDFLPIMKLGPPSPELNRRDESRPSRSIVHDQPAAGAGQAS
jgi:hypothetical protein